MSRPLSPKQKAKKARAKLEYKARKRSEASDKRHARKIRLMFECLDEFALLTRTGLAWGDDGQIARVELALTRFKRPKIGKNRPRQK